MRRQHHDAAVAAHARARAAGRPVPGNPWRAEMAHAAVIAAAWIAQFVVQQHYVATRPPDPR